MNGKLTAAALVCAACVLAAPAAAQDQPGRYTMKDIEDGMLRLDTQTGAVSYCRKKEDTWACETAEDDQSALNTEITRLLRKNLELQNRVDELEKKLTANDENHLKLPNDQDLDKVMGFMERLMSRFYAFAKSLRDSIEDEKIGEET